MKTTFLLLIFFLSSLSLFGQDLIKLIKSGNLHAIQKMDASGKDIHQRLTITYRHVGDEEPSTTEMHPLTYAAAVNQLEIVKFYLTKKDQFDSPEYWSSTIGQSFICALATKNDSLIELLYSHKPDLTQTCESCRNHNAAMVAAAYGLDKWYFILKENSDLSYLNIKGCSIVHLAVAGESVAILGDVVNSGKYDINLADADGFTPLDYAAIDSNVQAFEYLLKNGADINRSSKLWFSVAECGSNYLFQHLVANYNHTLLFASNELDEWPLHYALGFNHTELSLQIIELMKQVIEKDGYASLDFWPLTDSHDHALHWVLAWRNSKTYEGIVSFAHFINLKVEDPEYISFSNYYQKRATKLFGKEFVNALQEKYPLTWY